MDLIQIIHGNFVRLRQDVTECIGLKIFEL